MDMIEEIVAFLKAQQEAEEKGKQEFTCPLCGATARWGRSPYNNHLHCSCSGCGFRMIERGADHENSRSYQDHQ